MPFIPHTQADVDAMLAEIGADSIDDLFDEIPAGLANGVLTEVPEGMSELAMLQLMAERAERDDGYACFLGAGCYDHHIPAAVWDLAFPEWSAHVRADMRKEEQHGLFSRAGYRLAYRSGPYLIWLPDE